MIVETKRCTKCGETRPLDQFYLKSRKEPEGARRAHCKSCERAYSQDYRRNGAPLDVRVRKELVVHGSRNPEALSPEVRDVVFTDTPICQAAVAAYEKRRKAEKAREKRSLREAAKRDQFRPMRWGTYP